MSLETDQSSETACEGRRRYSSSAVLGVAVLGSSMAFVDATIVNISVPSISHDFAGSPLSSVSWVLNAYNVVFAAFLIGGGQLADVLGRRRVFSAALVLFSLASALCALAPTLDVLILARVVQAGGAAMLIPSSLAIALDSHAAHERMRAITLWTAAAAAAAGIGPPLGGVLITASGWRLVFLVNIPIGLLALALGKRVLPESRSTGDGRLPDLFGEVVLAGAIAALVLAIVKGQEWGWGSARVIGALLTALVLGGYFLVRASRRPTSLIDPSLLRIRSFTLANLTTVIMASGFFAYTLCNVLFLTGVWRYSILQAGLALTPGPFTAMAVAAWASHLIERVGYRAVSVAGALIWAGGMAYFASGLGATPDFLGQWLPGIIVLGVGAGLAFPAVSGAAVMSVPGSRFALTSAMNSVARQIGAALGVAALVAIVGNPTPAQALQAFENGWIFAGLCFLAGAAISAAVVVRTPSQLGLQAPRPVPVGGEGAGVQPVQQIAKAAPAFTEDQFD